MTRSPTGSAVTMTTKSLLLDALSGSSDSAGIADVGDHSDALPTVTDTNGALAIAADPSLVSSFAIGDVDDCAHAKSPSPLHSDCWAVVLDRPRKAGHNLRADVGPTMLEIVTDTCIPSPHSYSQEDCDKNQTSYVSGQESQHEQALLQIFLRRALTAGDNMHCGVDNVRDAIRQSDPSSAWFTRYLAPITLLVGVSFAIEFYDD